MKMDKNYYCTAKDRLVSGELFSVYFNNDRTVARTKIDSGEDMYRFYKTNNYHSHQETPKTFTDKIYFISRRLMLHFKYRLIKPKTKNPKLLDYGCGNGNFLKYLSDKNINSIGVEKSLLSQRICRSKGLNVFSSIKDIKQSKYNVITLWHVLEHVSNPLKCISALSKLLSIDGSLVIAVPNIQSIDSQLFKSEWAALDVPRHLWHFTPKGLIDLLQKEHFVLHKKRSLFLDAYYISLLSARRKKIFFPWLIAVFVGTVSNIFGVFTGNCSSSVFVFKKRN